jgi:hypothetical protein
MLRPNNWQLRPYFTGAYTFQMFFFIFSVWSPNAVTYKKISFKISNPFVPMCIKMEGADGQMIIQNRLFIEIHIHALSLISLRIPPHLGSMTSQCVATMSRESKFVSEASEV